MSERMTVQEHAAWLEQRRAGLGSTDAAPILGISKWKTPLHVYIEKTEPQPDSDSRYKKWGRLLEEVVAQAYHEETGDPVMPPSERISIHHKHSILLASLDRITQHDGEWCVLEIKTSETEGDGEDRWGAEWTDEIPREYLAQTQHQMLVTGYRKAVVAVLIGGNRLRFYLVKRNDRFIDTLEKVAIDFWRLVESRTPPPVDWRHPRTLELIKNMYGLADDRAVELPLGSLALAREYILCRADKKAAEEKQERVKAELLLCMGDAAVGLLPDGTTMYRKKVNRAGYQAKPTSFISFSIKPSGEMEADVERTIR